MYEHLTKAAKDALKRHFGVVPDVVWEYTQGPERGDISTCIALQIAKNVKSSPRAVAEVLEEALNGIKGVSRTEIAGSGYVNVWLTPEELLKGLIKTRTACTAKVKRNKEAPVIIDYSQPNIAKPLGVHHLLSTLVGQAVSNMYEHLGYSVVRWNYLGDWGTQFGKLAVAVEKWGTKSNTSAYTMEELLDLYVRFHDEVENNPFLEDEAREKFAMLERGDQKLRTFWEKVVSITKKELQGIYDRLNVRFDTDIGESFYENKMEGSVQEGRQKGIFITGEKGALIVQFPVEDRLPSCVVLKTDGSTIYLTRDLALMRHRIDQWHPQKILFVVDVAQSLYFQQLFATVKLLKWKLPDLEHVVLGRMRFQEKSMSTRKGNILKLKEVIEEAIVRSKDVIRQHEDAIQTDKIEELSEMMGLGAIAYGILSQNRKQDLVFDWKTFFSFEGNSAPYLQYTHARSRSVLRKANQKGIASFPTVDRLSARERKLIGMLLQFSIVLDEACATHMPHKLANYLYTLCQDYNAFYNSEPILQAPEPSRTLRLGLTACAADVLKTGAELLTLRVPDRM